QQLELPARLQDGPALSVLEPAVQDAAQPERRQVVAALFRNLEGVRRRLARTHGLSRRHAERELAAVPTSRRHEREPEVSMRATVGAHGDLIIPRAEVAGDAEVAPGAVLAGV